MNYAAIRNIILIAASSLYMTACCMDQETAPKKINVGVRPATVDDLPALLEVDREVTFEHFLPLMTQHYPELYSGKTPQEGLEEDLKKDAQNFERYITEKGDERLHVAYNTETNDVTGFVLSSTKDRVLNIDLLFVTKAHRQQGTAKKLFTEVVQTSNDVDRCYFYALDKNETVLNCIQKLGIECTPVNPDQKIDSGQSASLYKHYWVEIADLKAKLTSSK